MIPQDGINLAFVDGDWEKGLNQDLVSLLDGWGIEGMVGKGPLDEPDTPNEEQQKYMKLVEAGLLVTDTTVCKTQEELRNYYDRAKAWGIIPYPRIGGELSEELFPAWRWAVNGDYFWVEDPEIIQLGDRMDGKRNIEKLTDAKNYLYNINGRPYDVWETWDDDEKAAIADGEDGDRVRIFDSYGCGLLIPSKKGGHYKPVAGEDGDQESVDKVIETYGENWDWWWREAGLDPNMGRETWLNALRSSDYDVIYIDSFYNHRARPENQTPLTREEVESLKKKPDGGRRQVIAYLSIGSAEQNRWYCQDDWVWVDKDNPNSTVSMKSGKITGDESNFVYSPPEDGAPVWLAMGYGGNYAEEAVVQWWHPDWRDIIIRGGGKYSHKTTGDNTSSIDRIIDQGFDGVYLDNIGVYSRQSKRRGGWNEFEAYWLEHGGIPGEAKESGLVLQDLNYSENPVDIPNPDRGFECSNDDAAGLGAFVPDKPGGSNYWGYMTVPASKDTILGQTFNMAYEMTPPIYFGPEGSGPDYCGVPVEPRIVQFYIVLNEFSSNAWCDSKPGSPGEHDRVGVDGPITQYGLDFIKSQLEFIRNETNSVAHIRVCYDPKGWNQFVWTADNLKYEDLGPATEKERYYFMADYTKSVDPKDQAAHIAKPGAGTWRGSSPVFRKCTIPGFEELNWVQYHYLQLKPIFQEYSDVIWAFDSGTFGPWGESHSNYEAEKSGNYKLILDSLLDAVPDGKPIMTHVGGFLDWYNRTYGTTYGFGDLDSFPEIVRGTPEARFGMFDDSNGFSPDEYSYGDNGSLTEGYRMLAHDPLLPGYNPSAHDPSLTREGVSSVIGYNDSGTNRLAELPEELDDPRWRGVHFIDWDRTKMMNFLGSMSVYGGEQIGKEPESGTNGAFVPIGERIDNPANDVILRFPSMFYEHSLSHWTYMCMQQGPGSFKSRADYPYSKETIDIEITYPWNGKKVKVLYDPLYEGQSALAYYRDRMGFRFVLREANANAWIKKAGTLSFDGKIQNVGWGDLFNKKQVSVMLQSKATDLVSKPVAVDIDPYDWKPAEPGPNGEMPDSRATNTSAWHNFSFSVPLENFGNLEPGQYKIYLKINDPKETTINKRSIRFANKGEDAWNEEIGANLIGYTQIISDDN